MDRKKTELPKRKHTRLSGYDYSQNGCYFVTICTKNRAPLLCDIDVGRDVLIPPKIALSDYGKVVDLRINVLSEYYKNLEVNKYIIMPNHVHMLMVFNATQDGGMKTSALRFKPSLEH